jgi:hypothetical protein
VVRGEKREGIEADSAVKTPGAEIIVGVYEKNNHSSDRCST